MNRTIEPQLQVLATATPVDAITPFPNFTDAGLERVRKMFAELALTRSTLATLFALDAAQTAPTDHWMSFFVETASAFLIWDERPTGTLVDQDAAWVLAKFDEAPTLSAMALLVRLINEAQITPSWFPAAVRHRASLFRQASLPTGSALPRNVSYLRLVA